MFCISIMLVFIMDNVLKYVAGTTIICLSEFVLYLLNIFCYDEILTV